MQSEPTEEPNQEQKPPTSKPETTAASYLYDIHSWWEIPCIAHFCSLFRASFNLVDFDIEDLEEALLTDDATDGGGNTLIQELMEYACFNPFDNDMDFQFLPLRTKVEILHMLCDFRLDAEDVMEMLKDLDADSLRVHPLGFDLNKSAYWYFYGTRLYKEDYPQLLKKKEKKEKRRGRKRKRGRNKEEDGDSHTETEIGTGIWQVACYTESDWERLVLKLEESGNKDEKALHRVICDDFLPEIPKLFAEKERLQRKRFLEFHPRKSTRIEKQKQRKDEEKKFLEDYKQALLIDTDSEEERQTEKNKKENERHARWLNRSTMKEMGVDDSDGDSAHESANSNEQSVSQKRRQTNNSLSSATGQIIINSDDQNNSIWDNDASMEDLHIGMYKILNKLKDSDDSWPFLEPVDEDDAPNYYQVVKNPMSLQWMEEKLDHGKYHTFPEFKKDFRLILNNCKQYNGSRNEYTVMGENLERIFRNSVSKYLEPGYSTDSGEFSDDVPEVIGQHRKKKRGRKRKNPITKGQEDTDKENEESFGISKNRFHPYTNDKIDDDSNSLNTSNNMKDNASYEALHLVTEETLRDIDKWLDHTPKYSEFDSTGPPSLIDVQPNNEPEITSQHKLDESTKLPVSELECKDDGNKELSKTPLSTTSAKLSIKFEPPPVVNGKKLKNPRKIKDGVKKRLNKDNQNPILLKKRQRNVQRTIARLQPGKSKGNLLSNKSFNNLKYRLNNENKVKTVIKEYHHRPRPMLSLGSVLSNVNFGTDKKQSLTDTERRIISDEEDTCIDAENSNRLSHIVSQSITDEKLFDEKEISLEKAINKEENISENNSKTISVNSENSNPNADNNAVSKSEKPTPNWGAWLKAFGTPKTPQKRKPDTSENPATPAPVDDRKDDSSYSKRSKSVEEEKYDEAPPPTPGRFFLYEDERDRKILSGGPLSPDIRPALRQRRNSAASSISEHSSFSQDPNDPMSSPHPSLDEPYVSPQPLHLSPIHNTNIKVGFYQDTFPRGGSDKSNSCSPHNSLNGPSPQHTMLSPKDSAQSPADHGIQPPIYHPAATNSMLCNYNSAASFYKETDKLSSLENSSLPNYTPQSIEKSSFSMYPVKKRIYNEMEKNHGNDKILESPFVPTAANKDAEGKFVPTPGEIPQTSETISRHPLIESYSENLLLSTSPYFRTHHLYVTNPKNGTGSSHMPIFQQPDRTSLYTSNTDSNSVDYLNKPPSTPSVNMPTFNSNLPLDYTNSSANKEEALTAQYNKYHEPSPEPDQALNYSNKNDNDATQAKNNSASLNYNATSQSVADTDNSYKKNSTSQLRYSNSKSISNVSLSATFPEPYIAKDSSENKESKASQNYYPPLNSFPSTKTEVYSNSKLNLYQNSKAEMSSYPTKQDSTGMNYSTNMYPSTPNYLSNKSSYSIPDLRYNYQSSDERYNQPSIKGNEPTYPERSTPSNLLPTTIGSYGPIPSSIDSLSSSIPFNYALSNISQTSKLNSSLSKNNLSYHNHISNSTADNAYVKTPVSTSKRGRKKKVTNTVAETTPSVSVSNSNIFQHYLGQTNNVDLKSGNAVSGSPFNFNAASIKSDYQHYLENLRSSNYFADSVTNEKQPVTSAPHFPYLSHESVRPPFTNLAQAFMNPHGAPCPALYSPSYLQRPPEDLLRPMMLQQSLIPGHTSGYPPHGFFNMHDPINRSPWC